MPDAPVCDKCCGRQYVRTPHGWTPCVCYWHSRMMRETPTVLRADELFLPASVTSAAPWPVTEDRYEQGDWDTFRRQAWWSLAWHIGDQPDAPPLTVDVIDLLRLKEIGFNRDAQYQSESHLRYLDLLIITGGGMEPMNQRTVDEITAAVLRVRRLFRKATWCFALNPAFAQLPLFQLQPGVSSDATRTRQLVAVERKELPPGDAVAERTPGKIPVGPGKAAPLVVVEGGKVKQVW
jgi:hypothetical protein